MSRIDNFELPLEERVALGRAMVREPKVFHLR